ncbi:MAG: hypothetical protein Q9180_006097 [Flavoplaca navasiana]
MVGPLVVLDVEVVEVLVRVEETELLDVVADNVGLVVLVRLDELDELDDNKDDDDEVVETLDEEAATLELLDEIDDVDDCTDDELVALSFLYMFRRFVMGPVAEAEADEEVDVDVEVEDPDVLPVDVRDVEDDPDAEGEFL